jgi:hypothetical protein
MPVPTFLLLGAAKSGTTSFSQYLNQHPDVFMSSPKEPQFFGRDGEPIPYQSPDCRSWGARPHYEWETYQRLFDGVNGQAAIGEASPTNLARPAAAGHIMELLPNARLLAILRDPADRAYSQFVFNRRKGWESMADFRCALAMESERRKKNWSHVYRYVEAGRYHAQLSRFYALFPRENIRIYLYDDWFADNHAVLREAFSFLGVDPDFQVDTTARYNAAVIPRWKPLYRFLTGPTPVIHRLKRWMPEAFRRGIVHQAFMKTAEKAPPFPAGFRADLVRRFRDDTRRLQDLIGRDLSAWLDPARS